MTAKAKGLWDAWGNVDREDVDHMKSRVHRFLATAQVPSLKDTEPCAQCMCKWIVRSTLAVDAQQVLRTPLLPIPVMPGHPGQGQDDAVLVGMSALAKQAKLPLAKASSLQADLLVLGAVHVQELTVADWTGLPAWATLLPFEQRRLLAALPS